MSMVIGTNVASLTAQRHLAESRGDLETSMERLASGNRINSAMDDAAGLAISGRMEAQVMGLNQAVRNASDGISLAQTAEGALEETSSILQRMRELSVQGSNSTLTDADRTSIQAEVDDLTSEINRIASTTQFNNINLLDGTAKNLTIQVGAHDKQNVSFDIASATSTDLGLGGGTSGTSSGITGGRISSASGFAVDDIFINGANWFQSAADAAIGATNNVSRLEAGVSTTYAAPSTTAEGLAAMINAGTSLHGATATASNSYMGTTASGLVTTANAITVGTIAIGASNSIEELRDNINEAGADAQARIVDGKIELYNTTGAAIIVAVGSGSGSGLTAGTYQGFLTLENTDGSDVTISRGDNASAAITDVNALGFNERTNGSTIVTGVITDNPIAPTDDITLNGVSIGVNTDNGTLSAADYAAHLNTYTSQTNVVATAATTVTMVMDSTQTASTGAHLSTNAAGDDISINGVAVDIAAATDAISDIAGIINVALSAAGQSSIIATVDENVITLTDSAGGNIAVTDTNTNVAGFYNGSGANITHAATILEFTGNMTLTNTAGGDVQFGTVSGSESDTDTVLAYLGVQRNQGIGGGAAGAGSNGVSVSTAANAAAAITAIDAALDNIAASRGDLGAMQNRLDHTVSNLMNVSENMSAARSRINDADFATESANLAKSQVLQQAGTAMLAQANASIENVLSLLK